MGKVVSLDLLDQIGVAAPCSADWDSMSGDDRARFCADCKLHVYNLSAMSRDEAVDLISRTEGRLCIRLYRRADGTVLTRDCPAGLRAVRLRTAQAARRVAAAIALLLTGGLVFGAGGPGSARLRQIRPFSVICDWIAPRAAPLPPPGGIWMGAMGAVPSPAPAPPPTPGQQTP